MGGGAAHLEIDDTALHVRGLDGAVAHEEELGGSHVTGDELLQATTGGGKKCQTYGFGPGRGGIKEMDEDASFIGFGGVKRPHGADLVCGSAMPRHAACARFIHAENVRCVNL